jgi:miniconductance mechanosensitive channel
MTAVLLLIFKDTILSLVASVQIASNDMIHVGDWIEMPQCGADGDVIDIALHTVKIQNWDKTITTVPTHRFIEEGFKNWRGMSRSGGRRIKRAVRIDVNSIRFLTSEEMDRFESWASLRGYIREKRAELAAHNERVGGDAARADLRQLTNVGTFRAYVFNYLKQHPKIHHQGFTLLVRQLEPGPEGLPIEIYCFSNDQDWVSYEGIQSDIFDHILAILPEFGLRAYQAPSGQDLTELARRPEAAHG